MKQLYVKVDFPEVQLFQEHPRWNECIYADLALNPNVPSGTCFIPIDLYEEVMKVYVSSMGEQHYTPMGKSTTRYKD